MITIKNRTNPIPVELPRKMELSEVLEYYGAPLEFTEVSIYDPVPCSDAYYQAKQYPRGPEYFHWNVRIRDIRSASFAYAMLAVEDLCDVLSNQKLPSSDVPPTCYLGDETRKQIVEYFANNPPINASKDSIVYVPPPGPKYEIDELGSRLEKLEHCVTELVKRR